MSDLSDLADHIGAVIEVLMEIAANPPATSCRPMPAAAKLQALNARWRAVDQPKVIALNPDMATILGMAATALSDIEVVMRGARA